MQCWALIPPDCGKAASLHIAGRRRVSMRVEEYDIEILSYESVAVCCWLHCSCWQLMLMSLLVIGQDGVVSLFVHWVILEYLLNDKGWVIINEAHYYEHYFLHDRVVNYCCIVWYYLRNRWGHQLFLWSGMLLMA